MTNDMIALQALLEKSSDSDLLREMIGFAAHRLMELEVEGTDRAHHMTPEPMAPLSDDTMITLPTMAA